MSDTLRSFDMTIDISAPIDDVWRALTEAGELVRWFPLQATVTPGTGGRMRWVWDDKWTWETRIDRWDPPRRLRLVDEQARPFDIDGRQAKPGTVEPARIAIEFSLETRQGRTRLRIVHSGFGRGAAWDDEFDGITHGWTFELGCLRFYLERHRGQERRHAWANASSAQAADRVWDRLVSAEGFSIDAAPLEAGRPYVVNGATGDRFAGTVELYTPRRQFSGTVPALNDGVFRLETFRAGGKTGIMVWLAAWGSPAPQVETFGGRAQELLDRLFPAA